MRIIRGLLDEDRPRRKRPCVVCLGAGFFARPCIGCQIQRPLDEKAAAAYGQPVGTLLSLPPHESEGTRRFEDAVEALRS